MPKIITREYDNSKLISTISSTFAVVVPGVVKNEIRPDTDNSIMYGYDDNNKSIFDKNGVYFCNSKEDFEKYVGLVPGSKVEAKAPTLENLLNTETSETKYFSALTAEEFYETYRGLVYLAINEPSETVGYLHDTLRRYVKADKWDADEDLYCVIHIGNEGRDANAGLQNGNQIAYMLLDLGYEVLYKKYEKIDELETEDFWFTLKDKSMYQYRYLISGGYNTETCSNLMSEVAKFDNSISLKTAQTLEDTTGRGDVVALIDINEDVFANTDKSDKALVEAITRYIGQYDVTRHISPTGGLVSADKYSSICAPYITYSLTDDLIAEYDYNCTFPASFHYLACAAYAQAKYPEWFAVAGYNRGVCKYEVAGVSVEFGERLINTLAPRCINSYGVYKAANLILTERGNYYIWGNRTAEPLIDPAKNSAADLKFSHYLNIRQLCITIKQWAREICRGLTFDPNSDVLWLSFVNGMTPILKKMQAEQGIESYKITKVKSTSKGLITAKIRIVPIEAAEDFDINLYLEDSLSGITVSSDETE